MTTQIKDVFRIGDLDFCLVSISEPINFDPEIYGIIPESSCTACYRGYFCEYEVMDSGIFLRKLCINAKDNYYPPIEGIGPWLDEEGRWYHECGHHIYKGLNIKINYTGKILIGGEKVNWGFQKYGFLDPWAYEHLEELVFENGSLIKRTDQSQTAARIREEAKRYKALKTLLEEKKKQRHWGFGRKIEVPSWEPTPKLWWTK